MFGGATEDIVSEEQFDELYAKLKQAVEESGYQEDINLYKGDNYTFIRFRDQVFFDGDSSVIKGRGISAFG